MKKEIEIIKKIILDVAGKHGIEIEKIILFGSRARGDCREDSDWDILVVTKERLGKDEFWKLYSCLNEELISVLNNPVDIIVVDSEEFSEKAGYRGFLHYWAEREGVVV